MPGTVKLQTFADDYLSWMKTNVGLERQPGYVHVTVRLLLGDMTAGQMHVLADLAEAYSDGTARLTVGQNVLFRWVKVGRLPGSLPACCRRLDSDRRAPTLWPTW